MALFGKKKKPVRRRPGPAGYARRVSLPYGDRPRFRLSSREYRLFRRTEKHKLSWYEKLARGASRILTVKPDAKMREDLSKAIAFSDMRITPESVMSLFVLTVVLFVIAGAGFALNGLLTGGGILVMGSGLMIAGLGFLFGYYLIKYPINLVKTMRIKASSQVVLAVLYMVISMRVSPNLERALTFAASNVSGELAWDMRRVLWDIEMRKYTSANDALTDYIAKWKSENEEFAEALRLVRDSESHPPERSREVLDQALEIILDGTKTRMKHYAQDLRMPVMVIHMMGIVLPILGTIMAPLAAVFMSDIVGPIHFFIGYNVALPIVILWFIKNALSKRPMTFSQVDISVVPGLPKKGTFRSGRSNIPVLPISILIFVVLTAFPFMFFFQNYGLLFTGTNDFGEHGTFELAMSMLIVLGAALSLASYFILSNVQRMRIQTRIQKTEGEFELAMFQLGNRISGGTPTELAVEKVVGDMQDLEIAGLFRLTLRNIKTLGMTFEKALFDRNYGALRYYPSRLIRNIMLAVTDTARTGVRYAAESMLRIARYLKNIRETQEYIRDMLSETVSSMKFQAYFLTPMITGLIVSMSSVIVLVLGTLGDYLDTVDMGNAMGITDFASAFNMETNTSPEIFQLIVGIYLIEVIIILGIFLTKISEGDNKITQWYTVGTMLAVAVVIYFVVALMSSEIFAELIRSALVNLIAT
jgi:MFS family permease